MFNLSLEEIFGRLSIMASKKLTYGFIADSKEGLQMQDYMKDHKLFCRNFKKPSPNYSQAH